jgi:prepilin signal peptidase PulO-like enzyme (type II secretory pathway)
VSSLLAISHAHAKCTVNGEEIPCDQFWAQFGWIFLIMGLIGGLIILVAIPFWIWMLIDCLKSSRSDKVAWILVLFFGNIFGAVLYLFLARNKTR